MRLEEARQFQGLTQRFNRFSLTLGLGYDFPTDIRDAYFYFAYPFLISVPGYDVQAAPLPEQERERNLEMLRFISVAKAGGNDTPVENHALTADCREPDP